MLYKISFSKKSFKYFIGYKNGKKVGPLCEMLPKMSACRSNFDETKYMSFLIKNEELIEIYDEMWDKVSNTIKKRFDGEPVYNEKYLRTIIKEKSAQIFMEIKYQKKGSQCICLSIILIDSVYRTGENYYPQLLSSILFGKI